MTYYATKTAEPCAYITTKKQRVKQNGQNVYLENNTEFELEIFNPLQETVLAKIKLNGNYISSNGLIIKPGQRVFLERYLNEPKKFKFETYEVNGDSSEVQQAIQNNGIVEVEFYKEFQITYYNTPNTFYINTGFGSYQNNVNLTNCNSSSDVTLGFSNSDSIGRTYSTNVANTITSGVLKNSKKIETGTVEKGGDSNQSFTTVNKNFDYYHSYKSTWKILPYSQKNIEIDEIKVYCPECGTKAKKSSHKFCYNCGTKL